MPREGYLAVTSSMGLWVSWTLSHIVVLLLVSLRWQKEIDTLMPCWKHVTTVSLQRVPTARRADRGLRQKHADVHRTKEGLFLSGSAL